MNKSGDKLEALNIVLTSRNIFWKRKLQMHKKVPRQRVIHGLINTSLEQERGRQTTCFENVISKETFEGKIMEEKTQYMETQ